MLCADGVTPSRLSTFTGMPAATIACAVPSDGVAVLADQRLAFAAATRRAGESAVAFEQLERTAADFLGDTDHRQVGTAHGLPVVGLAGIEIDDLRLAQGGDRIVPIDDDGQRVETDSGGLEPRFLVVLERARHHADARLAGECVLDASAASASTKYKRFADRALGLDLKFGHDGLDGAGTGNVERVRWRHQREQRQDRGEPGESGMQAHGFSFFLAVRICKRRRGGKL